MKKTILLSCLAAALTLGAEASWYWPFGSDEAEDDQPRLSELMEPASELIDQASDLASEGKIAESVNCYREALKALDAVKSRYPDRVEKPEFATLRTKYAYVNAAIDSLLLSQTRENAKIVAVSDTSALEKRLAEEKAGKTAAEKAAEKEESPKAKVDKPETRIERAERPLTRKGRILKAIETRDFKTADELIHEMLVERPNGAAALNLRAAMETAQGRFKDAERTLDQAIQSNPRDYYAYYNMATLILQVNPENASGARRYYETGRAIGGPVDAALEEAIR